MRQAILTLLALCTLGAHAAAQSTGGQRSPVLLSIDEAGIDALRQQAQGRVLVLNLWATWCKPCVDEFPHLVKLQERYRSRGLDIVFISVDDDDARTAQRVRAFLKTMNVQSPSYLKKSGNDEAFINAVHPEWSGAVPATFVYTKRGELAAMKVEALSYEELETIILPLLAQ
jgi:thiol-disulfide isomerase/thioredoxin